MEEQCSPLSWTYYYQEEGVEELKQYSLLYSTLELEAAVISAHEEISRKDDEILQLKSLLTKIIKERDDFQAKCQQLVMEKQLLLFQSKKHKLQDCPNSSTGTTSNEEYYDNDHPSDSDDNNNNFTASSPGRNDTLPPLPLTVPPPPPPLVAPVLDVIDEIALVKPLPETGKFLQAVMEVGPLLQTLLVAGPLPQWQHPPPQLNSIDIPPVTIISSPKAKISLHQADSCLTSPAASTGGFTNKIRPLVNGELGSDFSPKYQKVCSPIISNPSTTL